MSDVEDEFALSDGEYIPSKRVVENFQEINYREGYLSDSSGSSIDTIDTNSSTSTLDLLNEQSGYKKPLSWRKFCQQMRDNTRPIEMICNRNQDALQLMYVVGAMPVHGNAKMSHRRTATRPAWENPVSSTDRANLPEPNDIVYEDYSSTTLEQDDSRSLSEGSSGTAVPPSNHQIFYPPGYTDSNKDVPMVEVQGMLLAPKYYEKYILGIRKKYALPKRKYVDPIDDW